MQPRNRLFYALSCCLFIWGCAQPTMPTGGPKDQQPPKMVAKSQADSTLNTRLKSLTVQYDEFVTVGDAIKEITIAPLLKQPLKAVAHNRKVTITLPDEPLDSNTTYTLRIGNAIKDVHEGNAAPPFTYTFSTGSYFDSLTIEGKVLQASTGLPDTNKTVVLLIDVAFGNTGILNGLPKYVSTVQPDGSFKFTSLPPKQYYLFALKDQNDNNMYDGNGEQVAFLGNAINSNKKAQHLLRLFATDTVTANSAEPVGKDKNRASKAIGGSYKVGIDTTLGLKRTVDIYQPIDLQLPKNTRLEASKIILTTDSNQKQLAVPFSLVTDTTHGQLVKIKAALHPNTVYKLQLQKGFATDSGGSLQPSTYVFKTLQLEDYCTLGIHIPAHMIQGKQRILLYKENNLLYDQAITDSNITFKGLLQGKYNVFVLDDANQNGHWDAGDVKSQIQPEWVHPHKETILLKTGWQHTVDFSAKTYFDQPKKQK